MIAARKVQPPPPLAAQVPSPGFWSTKSEVLVTVKLSAKTDVDADDNNTPPANKAAEIATPLLNIDPDFMTALSIQEWKFHIDIDLSNKQRLISGESLVFL
jgi:hypothetical protein